MKVIGLYLHFPFCVQKCRYCDFPSCAGHEDWMAPYLEALLKEIKGYASQENAYRIDTVFMGGGTPTLFHGHSLVQVLDACKAVFDVAEDAEISIECNPGTVDRYKLECLRNGGFNRLSVGLQAWQNQHLAFLGRVHRQDHFRDTLVWAREAGFLNINADVMYGIPGQTLEEWEETLDRAAASGITHLSAYSLKVEEGTVFDLWENQGRLQPVDDTLERAMYHRGIELLEAFGFQQYEISNFSKPGFASRHNLNYWRNGEYLGLGSGAHGYLNGIRQGNVTDLKQYIERMEKRLSPVAFSETIDRETELLEALMLGFRLNEGINKDYFQKRYSVVLAARFSKELKRLVAQGLITEDHQSYRPTPLGLDFQNTIVLTLMDGIC